MCCTTGVCGPSVDPALPRFAADLEWLEARGVVIERFNLSQEPGAFVARPAIREALSAEGNACLPLVLIDNEVVSRGEYPTRDALARLAGLGEEAAAHLKDPTRPGRRMAELPFRVVATRRKPENQDAAKGGNMDFINNATRYLFFTGKGGVGKTSTACATAIALADKGHRVLLVCTDPASNLDEVLGVTLSSHPTAIPDVTGLFALNINPEEAARDYRERVVGPYRDVLPAESVASIEEQLSGACTVEVAAFDEFTAYLNNEDEAVDYDHVIFDTAPTGHTLRLLQLPGAWTDFLKTNERGASCLGPASGLKTQQVHYASAVATLADPQRTTLVLVTRPETGAMQEAERTSAELESLGMKNQSLVINGIFRGKNREDELAVALESRGEQALEFMPERLRALPHAEVLLRGHNIVGVEALRELTHASPGADTTLETVKETASMPELPSLSELVEEIATSCHGLVMVMGKGGVGKTSIAAALALQLVARGLPVHLTTTDPAAHLTAVGGTEIKGLRVSRIDAEVETEAYRQRVLKSAGKGLDADGLALLNEDLRSPCTEEVAVFHAFSRIVAGARREVVVVDTAPTGHTLLLLDATGAYHREVTRTAAGVATNIVTPMMRLRDPNYTKVLLVTLAETTPVTEAAQLQDDLRRAGIEPFAWVINSSLAAAAPKDPLLVERAQTELKQIHRVQSELARRVAVVPFLAEEPTGFGPFRELIKPQAVAAQ